MDYAIDGYENNQRFFGKILEDEGFRFNLQEALSRIVYDALRNLPQAQ